MTGKSRKGDKNRHEVFGIRESSTSPVNLPAGESWRRIKENKCNWGKSLIQFRKPEPVVYYFQELTL
ncbi:hypothetical protein MSSAC_2640 [Methanosarcina siciliae C2J]|uniref:Uncharacterized protein n=1 Tax=Methanosarcina siciliae C2J TaxID=1434118 RepID=A0A0E3PPR1_9EURY|nr:hypothetical protein MSSAC_2640 [Methanosarcina siciliae C2J]